MLFNSYTFIFVFLPITLLIYFGLARLSFTKPAKIWLVAASLFFYAYWSIFYLPLLLLSILVNYRISELILAAKRINQRRIWLYVGLLFNFGLLAYFKYFNFFIATFAKVAHFNFLLPGSLLPIGISFYTFTQSAYLIDASRGKAETADLLTFSLFVTYFPHLIAGPILHHETVIPQFNYPQAYRFSHENLASGLVLFILGLSKKVIIADPLSRWLVAPVFSHLSMVNGLEAWLGVMGYTFELYFDFSGYSDMAVGLGLMLNVQLPFNFNSPYRATSISDFWRRWHITLSNYLRNYLYIPLGGNRLGQVRQSLNLLVTMLLGGLWHGAGWNFIIWGGLHGICLVINHWWRKLNINLPVFFSWLLTFTTVVVGWVFFRCQTLQQAKQLLMAMSGLHQPLKLTDVQGVALIQSWVTQFDPQVAPSWQLEPKGLIADPLLAIAVLVGLCFWVVLVPNSQTLLRKYQSTSLRFAVVLGSVAMVCLLSLNQVSEFLYFQF